MRPASAGHMPLRSGGYPADFIGRGQWRGPIQGNPGRNGMPEIAQATLQEAPPQRALVDPFARAITYLRVSVTDRCDFRCVYCMSEHMTFLPKADLLTLEELDRLSSAFIALCVRKLRLTGGEPL